MSLEEQLRNDAQSLREVGWFNRAIMMDAAANEIQKLNERIKRLVQAGDCLLSHRNSTDYHEKIREWDKAKKDKLNNEHLKLREEYISEIERENERLKEQNKRQNEAIDSLREMYAKEAKP